MVIRSMLFGLALVTGIAAQSCPDMVVQTVPLQITARAPLSCDDPSLVWRPVGSPQQVRGCPGVVVIEPGHDAPLARPGSGTYVQPAGRPPVLALTFTCKTAWFLFIPLATNCELVDKRVIAFRSHYEQFPCPVVEIRTDTMTTGS